MNATDKAALHEYIDLCQQRRVEAERRNEARRIVARAKYEGKRVISGSRRKTKRP